MKVDIRLENELYQSSDDRRLLSNHLEKNMLLPDEVIVELQERGPCPETEWTFQHPNSSLGLDKSDLVGLKSRRDGMFLRVSVGMQSRPPAGYAPSCEASMSQTTLQSFVQFFTRETFEPTLFKVIPLMDKVDGSNRDGEEKVGETPYFRLAPDDVWCRKNGWWPGRWILDDQGVGQL